MNKEENKEKKVLFFGIYNPEYSRNRVLMRGFKENGFEVFECRVAPQKQTGFKKYWKLYKEYKKIKKEKFRWVIVAFPGQGVVWLAFLLFGRNIIFDAFLSLYDSNIYDRKVCKPFSFRAFFYWFLDWYSCLLAKKVLLDTNEHIKYFSKTFLIPKKKFIRVFIGSDDLIFYPKDTKKSKTKKENSDFVLHFHGNFIPLQGIEYIIEASNILKDENFKFNIVGDGGTLNKKIKQKVLDLGLEEKTVFHGRVPIEEIPCFIENSDICLGIFGDTEKTKRVIPNKVYECMAMKKPIITADTPAIKEIFKNYENVILSSVSNGADLAEKIKYLKENKEKMEEILENAYDLYNEKLTPERIINDLISSLQK